MGYTLQLVAVVGAIDSPVVFVGAAEGDGAEVHGPQQPAVGRRCEWGGSA